MFLSREINNSLLGESNKYAPIVSVSNEVFLLHYFPSNIFINNLQLQTCCTENIINADFISKTLHYIKVY